jgi:serine/threonine-protein kinase
MIYNSAQGFSELQPGTTLCNGKYLIERKIGEGGFGITYKAVQSNLGRMVCVKEYFPAGKCVRNIQSKTVHLQGISEAVFEKYRQIFVKEAKTLASLKHSNIVEVIDVFDENNTSYMVMTFIEGQDLQTIVEKQGRLSYPDAVNYIAQIASAVGYIHEKNILHRDIKPDNVMITADYKAILIDFGAAREFEHDKTQRHTAMLTHGYAPAEQYTANSRIGAYTDIYAIGATLYFALTGKHPLETAARMTEKMPEPKELNPNIPEEANRTILKAMQIKAENRHQNVQEFMDDLRNIKPSKFIDETIGSATVVVGKKSKKLLIGIIVAATLLFAGGGVGLVLYFKPIVIQKPVLDTITKIDTIPKISIDSTKEVVETKSSTAQEKQRKPTVKTYSFGKYSGSLKNGIPEGEGKMFYTRYTQIAKHASAPYYAENGDVFVGTWGNGDIMNGKLFDKNNNLKATILAGKRPNPYNIDKD